MPQRAVKQDAYYWRLIATALSFSVFGIGGVILLLVVFPLQSLLPGDALQRRRRARLTVSRLFMFFIKFMRAMGVLTFQFDGAERLGRPGQLIIANHPSLLDVVFLIAHLRDTGCVVKESLWRNPSMRGPVQACGYISNNGSAEMLDDAAQTLRDGQTLIIFPEGTRTTPGLPPTFHRGAAAIALRGAQVITPVYISVNPTTLTKAEPWYRIPARRMHYQLRVGADLQPAQYLAGHSAPIASRHLNQQLHQQYTQELAV